MLVKDHYSLKTKELLLISINNISVLSWQSVSLVEETTGPVASH